MPEGQWSRSAEFSPGDPLAKRGEPDYPTFRYALRGDWDGATLPFLLQPFRPGRLLWIGLNPSRATHFVDDPTVRRIQDFTLRARYRRYAVVNLFAYRSRHPQDLVTAVDPVGPRNAEVIREHLGEAAAAVCAWGTAPLSIGPRLTGPAEDRIAWIRSLLARRAGTRVLALGYTDRLAPRHPLYVKKTQPLVPMRWLP